MAHDLDRRAVYYEHAEILLADGPQTGFERAMLCAVLASVSDEVMVEVVQRKMARAAKGKE